MNADDAFESVILPEILDLHLGRLTPPERDRLGERIAGDPGLAEQDGAVAGALAALASLRDVPAPAGLTQRIQARIALAGPAPRRIRLPDELTRAVAWTDRPIIRLSSLRDIVAAAAMIVLAVGVGVPSMLHMRARYQRSACSQNLQLLGQGLQQYASMFDGGLPFVGWDGRKSWRPSREPGVTTLPNRAHVYPLLRYAFVREPRLFVCPARADVPMPADQVARRNDFLDSRNVSYAYFNMAGARPSRSDSPDLPIMSDDNPLFEDGVPLLERLSFGDPAWRNSRAHRGAGQNILTLDGHVKWVTTPQAGLDGDNIWTLDGVDEYTGREGPRSPRDAHLLK